MFYSPDYFIEEPSRRHSCWIDSEINFILEHEG